MCDKCKDYKFVHPRNNDGSVDYSRVVQCTCTKQPGREYHNYSDNHIRDPYFLLLRRIQELEDALVPAQTFIPQEDKTILAAVPNKGMTDIKPIQASLAHLTNKVNEHIDFAKQRKPLSKFD